MTHDQATIEASKISARATVEAARIAADVAQTNGILTAIGATAAVLAAAITAYVTFRNARDTILLQLGKEQEQKATLSANLRATIEDTIKQVDDAVMIYKGDFAEPVELRVLPLPSAIERSDPKGLSSLGPEINEAIALARLCLNDYRRAKEPIQNRHRKPKDTKPAQLKERPSDFDTVISTAEAYSTALRRLNSLLATR
ncbi:hypothetical protein GA0061098_101665 [Bradyrhizobium shewense]|uniref:Uncharacterized protein n=1 Tax=Bradyrhizobium shewense TaxID=1761772 RepID=A0A1C3XHP8_9BRAD|nr:hypothetical protein [Bradyrhizobium shewense]SCB51802.1 hypothetical protein GA0061098_101665 [Bradyrhizobium shewense]